MQATNHVLTLQPSIHSYSGGSRILEGRGDFFAGEGDDRQKSFFKNS
jgi:hypothetical protein